MPPHANDNLGHLGGDTCHLGGDTDSQDRQDIGKACQGRSDYLRVEAEAEESGRHANHHPRTAQSPIPIVHFPMAYNGEDHARYGRD
jgi:hypothetical protein